MKNQLLYGMIVVVLLSGSCGNRNEMGFRRIPSSESGIHFRNVLTESAEFNIFNYLYFFNGGGVAVGDVNGDGLLDVFFTSNQEPDKLYLNEGNFRFKDVTEPAGAEGFKGWATGVTMADVNNDGKLDIYVSYLGDYLIYKGKNQLLINEGNDANGVPRFTDRAVEYGLDLVGFSTQAAFFDYDRDGDLDMFMLNHSVHGNGTYGKSTLRYNEHALAGDRLLRNDNGRFVDVTRGSGIYNSVLGYGLGVAVSDVDLDGWPDIYVGNDFHENDYLYINQRNGTFKEVLEQQMNHTSRYTMGVDLADFNNDAFPDVVAMDMLPEDPKILKSAQAEDGYDVYNFKINFGYNHQFARNTLQLNNHNGTFSEIALMAGVYATDWSWATFFADFDLDGNKDLYVANGIYKRSNDLDYINFISADSVQRMISGEELGEKELKYTEKMPKLKINNYLFINNGDSTFSDRSADWGFNTPSYSQGAAYADLDNDGDLDLVVNNLEDEAFVYENLTLTKEKKNAQDNHYLQVSLKGKPGNLFGIGARVLLYNDGKMQMQECMPTRGYQSSVDYRLTFGLGANTQADSLTVVWNDGTFERLKNVKADRQMMLDQENAGGDFDFSVFHKTAPFFIKATDELSINYHHKENSFVEFNREALIPHMMSAEGPGAAVADVNGDGREDLFAGGAKWKEGHLYLQTAEGKFQELKQPEIARDSVHEDTAAEFFDADGDGDQDLVVVSGGNEFARKSPNRQPRLYLNDGKGNFTRSSGMAEIFLNGACVSIADLDADGDLDMFLGARSIPWQYGVKPDSYILLNDGKGNFTDATETVAPALKKFGFVKNATWADLNNDQAQDLVIAAEWSPITVLINNKGRLAPLPEGSGLEKTNGWWNVIRAVDFDNDGDLDLVAGNLGLNSKLKTSAEAPVRMYAADMDRNDSIDQILTYVFKGKEYPFATRDEMTKQMPSLKKKYLSYSKYASATLHDIFTDEQLSQAEQYAAYTFQSSLVENLGNGKFSVRPLPKAAQLSTVNAILTGDFDSDGNTDLLLAGNFYPINIQMGRNDASYGLLMKGNGHGHFTALPAVQSGFSVKGEVRSFREIVVGKSPYCLAIRNNNTIEAFRIGDRYSVTGNRLNAPHTDH